MAVAEAAPAHARLIEPAVVPWLVVGALSVVAFLLRGEVEWLTRYPDAFNRPVVDAINASMNWFVATFAWLFSAISWLLRWPMVWLQSLLHWLPWSATVAGFSMLAFYAGGWRLAVFTGCALLYMVVTGYWAESMNTLAMVGVAVPLAVALGFGIGVAAFRSSRAERIIQPCLDLMQTVPTFAYLVPILLLFGFGPVVGLIASAIYACPPMARNVLLGLKRTPVEVLESAGMSGTTRRQSFWWVEVPTALPQIMIGVNQTIMAALSMVIIAAIIGGFNDIGWEVLSTIRKAQFGQSLLAGLVIVLIAMILDRISGSFTAREEFLLQSEESIWRRNGALVLALGAIAVLIVIAQALPFLDNFPRQWRFYPAESLNTLLGRLVANYGGFFDGIKNGVNFFFLLPIKIGLVNVIRPVSTGIEFTPTLQSLYWALIAGLTLWASRAWTWRGGVATAIAGTFLFFGLTGIPWPVFFAVVGLVAWQTGGPRIASLAAAGMLFILLTGLWAPAMLSIYLCGAAVLFSFVVGGGLGIWAAENDRVSKILRPVNDTLQTMPQFVYLIPVLFLFQIGDFSALIAVIAYCIVPMIRYTEFGLRNVRPDVLEAATSIGCTRRQLLLQVKLPMAMPQIMLGLNQTIMYALAMLVIAALVGTRDLGQSIYLALSKADTGAALVAGFSIAIIAMIADRIIKAWVGKERQGPGVL